MTAYPVLLHAQHHLQELAESLTPADLRRPTPCQGWDVTALLSHVVASIATFTAAVDGGEVPSAAALAGQEDLVGTDPAGVVRRLAERTTAAWADLPDPEAKLDTFLGPLPAGQVLAIAAFGLVVHCWDLAVAVGRDGELAAELLNHAETVGAQVVPGIRAGGNPALFGPELAAPTDATATQRLMAFLGRAW